MLYYLWALIVGGALLYTYRYRVLFWIIRVVVKTMQLYRNFKNRNVVNNHLQFVTSDKLSDNIIVCHYYGYIDKKEHKFKVIKNALEVNNEVDDVTVLDSLELRNHIVHCSLLTPDESKMLELTCVFREFVYHFDKDDDLSRIEHFIEYVSKCYELDEIWDWYFVIYLNDKQFTEVKYKVREITKCQFKEVLRSKT